MRRARHRRAVAAVLVTVLAVTACGGGDDDAASATEPSSETTTAESVVDVPLAPVTTVPTVPPPTVELPAETPTELDVTELRPGECRAAQEGDTVVVNYVGVRSEDGTQFDSNFGRDPLPVTLGAGGVIPGWEQGLVGAKQGARLQLDIPADLAYGDEARGDVIKAGDALSFVIDVLTVVRESTPEESPTVDDIPRSTGATEVEYDDLVEGDCEPADEGMTAILHLVAARGDNGTVLQSTYESGGPQAIVVGAGTMLPGMVEGIVGMRPGGRRAITVPYADAFGDQGMPQMGLPPETDLVIIVDMLAVFTP